MFRTTRYINSEVINEVAETSEFEINDVRNNFVLMDIKGMFN
jgi:hypothetical protein